TSSSASSNSIGPSSSSTPRSINRAYWRRVHRYSAGRSACFMGACYRPHSGGSTRPDVDASRPSLCRPAHLAQRRAQGHGAADRITDRGVDQVVVVGGALALGVVARQPERITALPPAELREHVGRERGVEM